MRDHSVRDLDFASRVRGSFERQAFMSYLGAKIKTLKPGLCEIELPYRPELSQQHGFFHGGVVGTLADNACAYAAYTLTESHASILTVEYKLNLVAPGKGESLLARGKVVKSGRTLSVCEGKVYSVHDGKMTLCAIVTETLLPLPETDDGPGLSEKT